MVIWVQRNGKPSRKQRKTEEIYMNENTTKRGEAENLELTDAQADRNDDI